MIDKPEGTFRLFQFAGITVYLHWLWLLVGYWQIIERRGAYSSLGWNVAEYLSLFVIVLLHEFGHSFATRQVGGRADTIMLWPFGGIAYVQPPRRPGADLWSIAAGPLVNVALFLPLTFAVMATGTNDWFMANPDAAYLINSVWYINVLLLAFNMLPIYPLDGGQITRSLLWYWIGEYRSLYVASIIGFIGVAGLVIFAIYKHSLWYGVMAFLVFNSCRAGLMQARAAGKNLNPAQ